MYAGSKLYPSLAYIAKEVMHLRSLTYVIDTGRNLDVAVENKVEKHLGKICKLKDRRIRKKRST